MLISPEYAQSIAEEMKASIHQDINVMDEKGLIIASTDQSRIGHVHKGAQRIIREKLPSLVISADDPSCAVRSGINLPILQNGVPFGVIGITGEPEKVCVYGDIIKKMTELMMSTVVTRQEALFLEQAKCAFLESCLCERLQKEEIILRGQLLGFCMDASYAIALVEQTSTAPGENGDPGEALTPWNPGVIRRIRGLLHEKKGDFCCVVRHQVVILLCNRTKRELLSTLYGVCGEIERSQSIETCSGISAQGMLAEDIQRRYSEAKTACAVAKRRRSDRIVFYDEGSVDFVIESIPRGIRVKIWETVFSGCTEEERETFAQLVKLYYHLDGNLEKCAERLYVHRNTVQYRMKAMRQKTRLDLRKPKEALMLYLASLVQKEQEPADACGGPCS